MSYNNNYKGQGQQSTYKSDWQESVNSYYFRVHLPNFTQDEILVKVKTGTLYIDAKKSTKSEVEDSLESNDEDSTDLDKEAESENDEARVETKGNKIPIQFNETRNLSYSYHFDLPADKISIKDVHAFIDNQLLVIKMPKLKKSLLPSFNIKVGKAKL